MTTGTIDKQDVRAELRDIGAELDRLKEKSAAAGPETDDRFDRYLDLLEKRCLEVGEKLEAMDAEDDPDLADIQLGLRDARQRLAIARKAARARFH
ncbi:MAG: hypothetical protein R3176_00145 [Woeseiaceae bacterium]|nr:hypothetical protein [Woeseiaceae bacterium]